MIRGLGTDVVELERILQAYQRYGEHFLQRVLSEQERRKFAAFAATRQIEFLAGRFAVKEAIAKAAGCGLGRLGMNRVVVSTGPEGLQLDAVHVLPGEVRDYRWHLSITHTQALAFATAIREDSPAD